MFPVTTVCCSFLALTYIYLSKQVISLRRKHQVSMGDKGYHDLNVAIRAHGNFSEYVPIALLLLLFAEANQVNVWLLSVLAFLFVLGRLAHAYTFLANRKDLQFRVIGMALTLSVIAVLAVTNLIHVIW